jgi:hypothetical protein
MRELIAATADPDGDRFSTPMPSAPRTPSLPTMARLQHFPPAARPPAPVFRRRGANASGLGGNNATGG